MFVISADLGPGERGERRDLAEPAHPHLDDAELGLGLDPAERQRHAELVVVVRLGRDGAQVRRAERREDVLASSSCRSHPVIADDAGAASGRARAPAIAASAACGCRPERAPPRRRARARGRRSRAAVRRPRRTGRPPRSGASRSAAPVTSSAQGRARRAARAARSGRARAGSRRGPPRARARSRATSRSSKGTLPAASSCSGSAPRPAITTTSPGRASPSASSIARRRSSSSSTPPAARRPRPRRRSPPGPRERGLSEVRIARSASAATTLPHQRPLAAVAVAAGAEDDGHPALAEARAPARITFSSESGVWA